MNGVFDIELPEELRAAIDDLAFPSKEITKSAMEMSNRYRSGGGILLQSGSDAAAYAAYRMPASYAAVHSALEQTRILLPG